MLLTPPHCRSAYRVPVPAYSPLQCLLDRPPFARRDHEDRSVHGAGRGEGKPFLEVIRNAELHEVFRQIRAASADTPLSRELRLRHPVPRILQISAVPLRLTGGGEPGVVMVLHDLTALRRLEQVRYLCSNDCLPQVCRPILRVFPRKPHSPRSPPP